MVPERVGWVTKNAVKKKCQDFASGREDINRGGEVWELDDQRWIGGDWTEVVGSLGWARMWGPRGEMPRMMTQLYAGALVPIGQEVPTPQASAPSEISLPASKFHLFRLFS